MLTFCSVKVQTAAAVAVISGNPLIGCPDSRWTPWFSVADGVRRAAAVLKLFCCWSNLLVVVLTLDTEDCDRNDKQKD